MAWARRCVSPDGCHDTSKQPRYLPIDLMACDDTIRPIERERGEGLARNRGEVRGFGWPARARGHITMTKRRRRHWKRGPLRCDWPDPRPSSPSKLCQWFTGLCSARQRSRRFAPSPLAERTLLARPELLSGHKSAGMASTRCPGRAGANSAVHYSLEAWGAAHSFGGRGVV